MKGLKQKMDQSRSRSLSPSRSRSDQHLYDDARAEFFKRAKSYFRGVLKGKYSGNDVVAHIAAEMKGAGGVFPSYLHDVELNSKLLEKIIIEANLDAAGDVRPSMEKIQDAYKNSPAYHRLRDWNDPESDDEMQGGHRQKRRKSARRSRSSHSNVMEQVEQKKT